MKGFRHRWIWSYSKSLGAFTSHVQEGDPLVGPSKFIISHVKHPKSAAILNKKDQEIIKQSKIVVNKNE